MQSIATLEAMASGLPVLAANKEALPEVVHDGVNGLLFKYDNANDLKEKILQLLNDSKLRRQMGEESLHLIQRHSLDNVVQEFENVYKETIIINNKNKQNLPLKRDKPTF